MKKNYGSHVNRMIRTAVTTPMRQQPRSITVSVVLTATHVLIRLRGCGATTTLDGRRGGAADVRGRLVDVGGGIATVRADELRSAGATLSRSRKDGCDGVLPTGLLTGATADVVDRAATTRGRASA